MGIILLWTYVKEKEIEHKFELSNCYVYNTHGFGNTFIVDYEYIVDAKVFRGSSKVSPVHCFNDIPTGKYFPMMIVKDKPKVHRLLLTRRAVEEFLGKVPDSLQWIQNCW